MLQGASHKQVISHKKKKKKKLEDHIKFHCCHIEVEPMTVENIAFYTCTVTECNLLMDILG